MEIAVRRFLPYAWLINEGQSEKQKHSLTGLPSPLRGPSRVGSRRTSQSGSFSTAQASSLALFHVHTNRHSLDKGATNIFFFSQIHTKCNYTFPLSLLYTHTHTHTHTRVTCNRMLTPLEVVGQMNTLHLCAAKGH